MEFTGILAQKVGQREGDGQNGHWAIASYIVQTVEQYPNVLLVEVRNGQNNRIAYWDNFIGKNVTIDFDPEANEWQGRWYGRNIAWRIREVNMLQSKAAADATGTVERQTSVKTEGTTAAGTGHAPFPPITTAQDPTAQQPGEGRSDDLPF